MKKKRNLKESCRKIFFCLIIIFVICLICRNKFYEYKFEYFYEKIESSLKIEKIDSNMDSISYLELLVNKNSKIKTIMDNKDNYPKILLEMLSKNLDMIDYVLNYLDSKGKTFSETIGDIKKGEFPLLLQYDPRWGYGIYGDEVLAINGCGPTSLAMVIAGLTGRNDITPYDIALYSYKNGYYEGVTSWLLFTEGVKKYGIIGTELSLSKSKMISELEQGHPIICSMRRGDFTTTGHIIVLTRVKDGKFIINDPNSKERSNMLWEYDRLKGQIKNLWTFKTK